MPSSEREGASARLRFVLAAATHVVDASVVLRVDGVRSAAREPIAGSIVRQQDESIVRDIIDMGGAVRAEEEALAVRGLEPGDLTEGVADAAARRLDALLLRPDAATPAWGVL